MKPFHQILTILFAGTLVLSACGGSGANPTATGVIPATVEVTSTSMEMPASTPDTGMQETPGTMVPSADAEFDQMFIDMMVPHHQSALEMARIALERSEHAEIRRIAQNILDTQQSEIDELLEWREAWYGSRETPPMSEMPMLSEMEGMGAGEKMDMQAEVQELQDAPEPFDAAFVDAMIAHHQQAVDAAQLALQRATHEEIRTMAQNIIDVQQQEIDDLKSLGATLGDGTTTPNP